MKKLDSLNSREEKTDNPTTKLLNHKTPSNDIGHVIRELRNGESYKSKFSDSIRCGGRLFSSVCQKSSIDDTSELASIFA